MSDSAFKVNRGLTLNPQPSIPTNPINGDIYYDANMDTFVFYDNGFWINLASRIDVASANSINSTQLTAAVVQNSLIRITGSTASNLYGLAASTGGRTVVVYNQSSAVLTIDNNSVSEPTAANRILTYNGGNVIVLPGQAVTLVYDDVQDAWILASAPGSSSGGNGGDFGLSSLTYQAVFDDAFTSSPTLPSTAVDMSQTNAVYSPTNLLFTLSYDATQTLTGTGTAMGLSAPATFTVNVGDVILFGGQARKITAVSSQISFTIEAAFSTNPSSSPCTVSQAVYTVDINNYTNNGTEESLFTAYNGLALPDFLLDYEDSATGTEPNMTTTPDVSFTASASGTATDYTSIMTRAELDGVDSITPLVTPGTDLFIRFFANPALSGSGTVNLLSYEAFIHNTASISGTGFALSQAYCFTDGSEIPVNCSQPTVVGGRTQISGLPFYSNNLNLGEPNGQLIVFVNGQKIPRYTSGVTKSTDAYYLEINSNTIQLDSDYSGYNFAVEIIRWSGVIDSNVQNTAKISALTGFIVGSTTDVSNGVANFSSLQLILGNSPPANLNIFVLNSYNTSEHITVSSPVTIQGQGRGTQIAGLVTITSQFATIKNLRFNSNVTISGTQNYVRECFSAPGVTITESTPGSNSLLIIGE